MALIYCRECGEKISETAKSCPKCGAKKGGEVMARRSFIGVIFLSCITMGIYALVWYVSTKEEMNQRGCEIPTAWLLIVPFANLYWAWKYSEGVEKVTDEKINAPTAFILLLFLNVIGMGIIQTYFNKVSA